MKWLGATILVACALLTGILLKNRMGRRVKLLGEIIGFTENAIGKISYGFSPPEQIISETQGSFFCRCRELVSELGDVRQGWRACVETYKDIALLRKEEKELISQIGRSLGAYDADRQISAMKHYSDELVRMRTKAFEEYSENGRLCVTCSALVGAFTALLVI